jgi:23S rRNA pseudouridine2605 synthase/16S rRNA pseudouridine516 synthase
MAGSDRVRLAKVLAEHGIASRRKAEEMIRAGSVSVNGRTVRDVTLVDPETDTIAIDGKPLSVRPPRHYYLLNKPRGYITGRADVRGRKTVLDLAAGLPVRVEPVGRLDYDTEGALLLTNDGQLAHALTHPSKGVPKTYLAVVEGIPNGTVLKAVRSGIELDDGPTAPAKARFVGSERGNSILEITVTEGRNRLIRRMMRQLGHPVVELRRTRFGSISLEGLPLGELRPLAEEELAALRNLAARAPRPARPGAR